AEAAHLEGLGRLDQRAVVAADLRVLADLGRPVEAGLRRAGRVGGVARLGLVARDDVVLRPARRALGIELAMVPRVALALLLDERALLVVGHGVGGIREDLERRGVGRV